MKYSEFIRDKMTELSKREDVVFIGYNLTNGSKAYGTLANVPKDKIIEMPVAEALMTGMATGMALEGYTPVLFFERHDFLLIAADQIINHLAKIKELSHGVFNPKVIIRAVVGCRQPFDPGPQHLGSYSGLFNGYLRMYYPMGLSLNFYQDALESKEPIMIVEHKGYYGEEICV